MLARHSSIYFVGRVVPAALAFAVLLAYTHLLSPAEYGVVVLVMAAIDIGWVGTFMPLCQSALRFCHDDEAEARYLPPIVQLHLALAVSFAAAGAVALVAGGDAAWRDYLLIGLLLLYATAWLELQLHLRMCRGDAYGATLQNLVRSSASSLLGCLFAWLGWGAMGVLVGMVAGLLLPSLVMNRVHIDARRLLRWDAAVLRELWSYAAPLVTSGALGMLAARCDRLFIAAFHGQPAVGLYALGQELANRSLQAVAVPIGSAGLPLAIRAYETGGVEAARRQLGQNVALLAAVTIPAAVGLIMITPLLTGLLVGPKFRDATLIVLPLAACAALFNVLRASYADHAFQITKRTGLFVLVPLTVLLVAVVMNLLMTPHSMVFGPAVAMVVAQAAGFTMAFVLGSRCLPLPVPALEFAKLGAATAAMAAAMLLLPGLGDPRGDLAAQIVAGGAVLVLVATLLDLCGIREAALRLLRRRRAARIGTPAH